jgi:hypothetical protein
MDESDTDSSSSVHGLATPPLSPTKSTSTYGWLSPRTPESPRKVKSCLFFRDTVVQGLLPLPSVSPAKPASATLLGTLQPLDFHTLGRNPSSTLLARNAPFRPDGRRFQDLPRSPPPSNKLISRLNNRSAPDPGLVEIQRRKSTPDHAELPSCNTARNASKNSAVIEQSCSPISSSSKDRSASSSPIPLQSDNPTQQSSKIQLEQQIDDEDLPETKLNPLALRLSGSPLRPSQWAIRGGLLPSPPSLGRAQDRFISSRRPPNVHKESFELNKPSHRLTAEERVTRGSMPTADPFSRRLHRSGRLNDELRTLRETHSVMTGRINPTRRGNHVNLRRGSHPLAVRQVSAGGVWAVGGPSAVSDTVVGVSDGRGGVLGSGTNAPLYTSMFLSRSDPEAELEVYESRLALAFDVDQSDKILEHSSPGPSSPSATKSNSSVTSVGSPSRHVWKDNSWTKDGPVTSPSPPVMILMCIANHNFKCPGAVIERSGSRCPFCHSDMFGSR